MSSSATAAAAAAAAQEALSSSSCSFAGAASSPQRPSPSSSAASAATSSSSSACVGTGAGGPSVLVVRDRGGAVFGCFASEPWGPPRPRYFGNGESFVFSLKPERRLWRWHAARCAVEVPAWVLDQEEAEEKKEGKDNSEKEEAAAAAAASGGDGGDAVVAKAAADGGGDAAAPSPAAASARSFSSTETRTTPRNDFFQLARPTSLALGGGPRFALALDADLARGRSGACETFGCAHGLASEEEFDVGRVELWSLH